MAIKPSCAKCEIELAEFGAILLGPPNEHNFVRKFHLCVACYNELKTQIEAADANGE